ncbi:hypothetical protein tb265_20520 [Gemmatimonadetes bacterium T265]|nr:hypothetical protein tb265_20520 [Gemmatimonadetes bacterium T265]
MTAAALLRPALVDAVLALLALESVWLGWRGRRTGAPGAGFVLSFAGAGAGLLIALRAVLAGWPAWVALAGLAAAGVSNLLHIGGAAARGARRYI